MVIIPHHFSNSNKNYKKKSLLQEMAIPGDIAMMSQMPQSLKLNENTDLPYRFSSSLGRKEIRLMYKIRKTRL